MSVCDRLNVVGFDITGCMVNRQVCEGESQANSSASRDTCLRPQRKTRKRGVAQGLHGVRIGRNQGVDCR